MQRLRVTIRGAVQGVGFRPFVYRLATEMTLRGWVKNSPQGVFIEAEGAKDTLDAFLLRLEREKPSLSFIQSLEYSLLEPEGYGGFEIRHSDGAGEPSAVVMPDIATCPHCRDELLDPRDRRHRYPFTNCTLCGPRFSIIRALPYDRANTTMRSFTMCPRCHREYEDPRDRRFHAQPNACAVCGPRLTLWDETGKTLATDDDALTQTAVALTRGLIIALKGLGGFQLLVDARNDKAVRRLRERKRREEKPLAVMFPDLETLRQYARVSSLEERLLTSPESPIVLVESALGGPKRRLAPSVAPDNPYIGSMLPYTPLHHLLMRELGFPVVATSGNLHDEPIVTDEAEAVETIAGIADRFLVHDRPIERHVDDSVVRVQLGREMVMRRARGYAPLPVFVKRALPPLLAVGGHLKNTVAVSRGNDVMLSQHIGDLETAKALFAFRKVIADLLSLYEVEPVGVAHDAHPDYLSTQWAKNAPYPAIAVQHHHAHLAACLAENDLDGEVLGVTWDGAGYGDDGTLWGGEFLLGDASVYRRVAHVRPFRLPGGEAAIKEPRRTALGLLHEIGLGFEIMPSAGDANPLSEADLKLLRQMLAKGVNSPVTTSAGRLFDAVAALLGFRSVCSFEGQAPMMVEFRAERGVDDRYDFALREGERIVLDWEPLFREIIRERDAGTSTGVICARFHNTLAEAIVEVAKRTGASRVVLTGGVFQNRYLTERAFRRLESEGFKPFTHQRVPPNDGGIALGQVLVAATRIDKGCA